MFEGHVGSDPVDEGMGWFKADKTHLHGQQLHPTGVGSRLN